MPSLLAYDKLVFRAAYRADAHSILDESGAPVGRIVKEGLVVRDGDGVPLLAIENAERDRKSFYRLDRSARPVAIADGRGRTVAAILGKQGRIDDASGQSLGAVKVHWRHPRTLVIEDSAGTEAGNLTFDLGNRGEDEPMEAATVSLTVTGYPTDDLRVAMLGFAARSIDIVSSQVASMFERHRAEPPS